MSKNVFVEPEPKAVPEGSAITHYVLEFAHGGAVTTATYSTQKDAVDAARRHGYDPLVARVRHTDKGKSDHWGLG